MSLTINQALAAAQLDATDARALLRHVLGTDDIYLISHGTEPLPDAQSDLYSVLVRRRRGGEPIAYITGTREFFSLEFKITPAVLIPRPETELLVEFALEYIAPESTARILDLGTGSGCIAISIARQRPRAQIIAVDASPAALSVARDNAQRLLGGLSETASVSIGRTWDAVSETPLSLRGRNWDSAHSKTPSPLRGESEAKRRACHMKRGGHRDRGAVGAMLDSSVPAPPLPHGGRGNLNLRLVRSDWFSALAGWQFDLIVANPPYVAAGDPHLAGELRFEPQSALVAGDDGLACIRLIVAAAGRHLNPGGWLAFEHGYDQGASSRELLAHARYARVFSRTDLARLERLSGGQWNAQP